MSYSIPADYRLASMTKPQLVELCGRVSVPLSANVKYLKAEIIELLTQRRNQLREAEMAEYRRREAERERIAKEALDLHRQSRSHALRKQANVEDLVGCLEYPLSYLDEYGGIESIQRDLVGQEYIELDPALANTIAEYLWIHEGCNDEEPWKAVARLNDGVFVFYKAECDYTGFDCQGHMMVWAARDLATLLDLAMDIRDYDQWISETAAVAEVPEPASLVSTLGAAYTCYGL